MASAIIIGSAIAAVAGSAISGITAMSNASAQSQAAEYNAQTARQQATNASRVAAVNEADVRRKNALALGEEAAAASEANIGLGGSAHDVLRQNAIMREMDALNVRYQGQLQRNAALNQSTLDTYAASAYGRQGNMGLLSGAFGVGSALLGSTGDYPNYQKTQLFRPSYGYGY